MQGYPNYQETNLDWLGKVPAHWSLGKLGACFSERNEKVSDTEYPALSVTKNGIVPQMEHVAKTDAGDNRKKVCKNDFVINSRSDRKGSAGVSEYDGSVSLISTVLEPHFFLPNFAHHLFRSYNFQEEFYRFGKGIVADLWSTRYAEMKNIIVPLVPLEEQEAIARFLDRETARIDNLITEKQTFIKLLKEKRQALISHVVTKGLDPNVKMKDSEIEWIGEVPEHWAICKISYRYEILLGKMLDEKKITGDHLGYYLRNTDVQWDKVNNSNLPQMDFRPEEIDRYQVQKGDLLVCEGGEIGRCAVWDFDEPCFYQKALHRVRPYSEKRDYTRFLFYVISDAVNQERFVSRANKATIAHLPADSFRQYRFAFPNFDEQVEVAAFLDREKKKFDRLLAETEESVRLLQEHRTALISAAVTGKIDVRSQVPTSPDRPQPQESAHA